MGITQSKLHNRAYLMATECSSNRRNISKDAFEKLVEHDSVADRTYNGRVVYTTGVTPTGWYHAATRSGYIATAGLKNNG